MLDIMVDIESLSTRSFAVILQIGACSFNRHTGEIFEKFQKNIQIQDSLDHGLIVDGKTILWWMDQTPEAREGVFRNADPLKSVLGQFNEFLISVGKKSPIWSHATFDYDKLQNAYEKAGMTMASHYRAARDIRTIVDLAGIRKTKEERETSEFAGVKHTALDDCINQVKYVCECFHVIGERMKEEE